MMNEEYSVLVYANDNTLPSLDWDETTYALQNIGYDSLIFLDAAPVLVPFPIFLTTVEPYPPQPVMADYHSHLRPVVSKRFVDALTPFYAYGLQFFPGTVRLPDATVLPNYFCMHIYNEIDCLDRNRASYEENELDGYFLDTIRLDESVLEEIDLPKRLIFALGGSTSTLLMHNLLVERLLPLNLKGVRFVPVLDWHSGSLFDK